MWVKFNSVSGCGQAMEASVKIRRKGGGGKRRGRKRVEWEVKGRD
jgi:hypothetical protein